MIYIYFEVTHQIILTHNPKVWCSYIKLSNKAKSLDREIWVMLSWDKLLMSTESPYHFDHLLQVSNKSFWILILYTFFNVFPHVYSPMAGADNPLWTKSWRQQKSLVTLPICCKFQKKYLWSQILYIIFHVFIHVYSPGAEADNPLGSELLCKHIPHVTGHLL